MLKRLFEQSLIYPLALTLLLLALPQVAPAAESYVLGYYPAGRRDLLPAEKIDFDVLTHICHAFIRPNKDATLDYGKNFLYPEMIRAAHAKGRKVLVSLGGGGGGKAVEGFPVVAADPALRTKFIANLIDFCQKHGYDGIDFDWEYPKNRTERDNHALLVSELREAVDKLDPPLLITMAIGARLGSDDTFDHAILKEKLDWFNVMTYDFHGLWSNCAGHNSPIYDVSPRANNETPQGCFSAVCYMKNDMGIAGEKLLLGLPFYGFVLYSSHIRGPNNGGHYIDYREVMLHWASGGWFHHWDEVSMVPWLSAAEGDSLITYDDPRSIALKCDFARVNGLRGVMIWALSQDMLEGSQWLLETVGRKKWDFK